jgi:glycosyltransferase involved in cell wall biosynthesis
LQEAMLHRLAVVAVAGGGASESVRSGENAMLCRNDPADLARAIRTLLTYPSERARIAENGFASQQCRTIPAMVSRILTVYHEVLSGSGIQV